MLARAFLGAVDRGRRGALVQHRTREALAEQSKVCQQARGSRDTRAQAATSWWRRYRVGPVANPSRNGQILDIPSPGGFSSLVVQSQKARGKDCNEKPGNKLLINLVSSVLLNSRIFEH